MKKNTLTALFLFLLGAPLFAQSNPSQLFNDFKNKSKNNVLPDFSYAGYHCGEAEIPNIKNYKIFDVTAYGAKPNDNVSDKLAIQKAIDAANKNGSGIVFFPKGRFLINEDGDSDASIVSKGSKIILRGSGSGENGTELFMKNTLQPTNPKQMWTVPHIIQMNASGEDLRIGEVVSPDKVGEFTLTLNHTDGLKANDWIVLKMNSNAPELVADAVGGRKVDTLWTELINKGVNIRVLYQVQSIQGSNITLHAPLSYPVDPTYKWEVRKFAHVEEVGVEDLAFVGNWKTSFVHHRSWQDDSGFSMLLFSCCTNSWMKNCRFTDCNAAGAARSCANMTIKECSVTGTAGHNAFSVSASTNVLLTDLADKAGMWHAFGIVDPSMNTVICNCKHTENNSFESHSSQPRNTLFDCVEGGLKIDRCGGARRNMPNHLTGMVMWNYTQTNGATQDFDFWNPKTSHYFAIASPIVVGFMSKGTTFKTDQLGAIESLGKAVEPKSLYHAQLELRLGKK